MKKCIVLFLTMVSFQAFANPDFMTVKERLRLSLWFEGLEQEIQKPGPKKLVLPEELEVPLKKN